MDTLIELLQPVDYMLEDLKCHLHFNIKGRFDDGSIEIRLMKACGEDRFIPFTTLSMYVPDVELDEYEFVVKNWYVNEDFILFLLNETDYFIDTEKTVETEYGVSPIWKFNIQK